MYDSDQIEIYTYFQRREFCMSTIQLSIVIWMGTKLEEIYVLCPYALVSLPGMQQIFQCSSSKQIRILEIVAPFILFNNNKFCHPCLMPVAQKSVDTTT